MLVWTTLGMWIDHRGGSLLTTVRGQLAGIGSHTPVWPVQRGDLRKRGRVLMNETYSSVTLTTTRNKKKKKTHVAAHLSLFALLGNEIKRG